MKKFPARPYVFIAMAALLLMGASAGAARLIGLDRLARQRVEMSREVNVDQAQRLARMAELARIKDDVIPVGDGEARSTRLEALAQIKDDVIPVTDRAARLARLGTLAQIKDDMIPVTDRAMRLARIHALGQIKDDVIP